MMKYKKKTYYNALKPLIDDYTLQVSFLLIIVHDSRTDALLVHYYLRFINDYNHYSLFTYN